MTATAAPTSTAPASTACATAPPWPTWTWCSSRRPTGWRGNYVHQVLLLEELAEHGCRVEFLDRPMSQDPHDQLLLQIRGAVAEYERTLIAERMRRGRLARLRAGMLLPWTAAPVRLPGRPGPAARPGRRPAWTPTRRRSWRSSSSGTCRSATTLTGLVARLRRAGVPSPTGKAAWTTSSLRHLLRNPTYTGTAYGNWRREVPSRGRRSPLQPVGRAATNAPRPRDEWIPVTVPAIVSQEVFDLVQEKLDRNRAWASRHNTRHQYLLRALVSCGLCRLAATARTSWDGRGVLRLRRPRQHADLAPLPVPLPARRAAGAVGVGRPVRAADPPRRS